MNRRYLKPITALCMILFLASVLAPQSFAGESIASASQSTSYVKHSLTPVANSCQTPIEEKVEEKNQDSITNFPILISYIVVNLFAVAPEKRQTCEFGHLALTGNTPLYLYKRTLLI
jgi:hypothetical protein